MNDYPNESLQEWEFLNSANDLAYKRHWSLTITLDKVIHYMKKVNYNEPPFLKLSYWEILFNINKILDPLSLIIFKLNDFDTEKLQATH